MDPRLFNMSRAAEREDAEGIAENQLFSCTCPQCSENIGIIAGQSRSMASQSRPEVVIAGLFTGVISVLLTRRCNAKRSREQLKKTFMRLAEEAFEYFADEAVAVQRTVERQTQGMH
jgi:hypothetical protein